MPNRLLFIIACLIALPSFAQQAPQTPSWMPKSGPESIDVFSHISIAKISSDRKSILFARPVFKSEQRTQEYNVTVCIPETRTRSVAKDDGTVAEETYTVAVPHTETRQRTYVASVPSDSERFDVAIDEISALDLGGNAIHGTALAARLHKPAYVLAIQGNATGYKPIDPFYLNVLRPETMVLFLPPGANPAPAPGAQQATAPAAPAAPAVPVPRPVR